MLSSCVNAPKHYAKASELASSFAIGNIKPTTIITAGMGGSAIGGELLKDWARDRTAVPIEVCREYSLPGYADENTLVIVVSYSGETEETLSAFLDAMRRKCPAICVSSGGTLQHFAKKLNIPHLQVPSGMAPRAALPYLFVPMLAFLHKMGLVATADHEITETIEILRKVSEANRPTKSSEKNFAKTFASNVFKTIPVTYGFGFYRAVAQRFKTQFNENSKLPAKWEFFPELDHNEIVGWEYSEDMAERFSVILIRDEDESESIRQRIEVTEEIIRKQSVKTFEVRSVGKSTLAKMASVICVGDFASIYLAILRGIDPTPVNTIGVLKERLKQSGVRTKIVRELEKLAKRSF
jgi:glucose/mannose-6-phosphate isomerase